MFVSISERRENDQQIVRVVLKQHKIPLGFRASNVAVMRQQLYYAAINVMSTQYQLSLLHAITREIDSSGQHELYN